MAGTAEETAFRGEAFESKSQPNFGVVFDFAPISVPVQRHLAKVYLTLSACLLLVALGASAHLYLGIGGLVSLLGTLVCAIGIAATSASPANEALRLSLLAGTSFLQGCSLGPLLTAVSFVDPSLVSSAVLATCAIFASFTGAALLAKRREFLFLGALLSSALSVTLAFRWASFLFGSSNLQFQLELYLGLFIFAGYVIYDTQLMVEKASVGRMDYINDALQLLIDFVGIFIRVLVLLSKQNGNREAREKRNKRR